MLKERKNILIILAVALVSIVVSIKFYGVIGTALLASLGAFIVGFFLGRKFRD